MYHIILSSQVYVKYQKRNYTVRYFFKSFFGNKENKQTKRNSVPD